MPKKSRRRSRKTVQYDFAGAPAGQVATEVDTETTTASEREAPGASYVRDVAPDGRAERHVSRDYSHVRNEVVRIVILGGVLIIAIVIAGFFR
ncbi:MAG: hypothetical protein IIA90_07490 [Chloroflexi bacterium]|nr:hypothetical protein [Chloroflexota bacterium]